MAKRDKLKREKCFPEYNKLGNKVKNLVRKAKKQKQTKKKNSESS